MIVLTRLWSREEREGYTCALRERGINMHVAFKIQARSAALPAPRAHDTKSTAPRWPPHGRLSARRGRPRRRRRGDERRRHGGGWGGSGEWRAAAATAAGAPAVPVGATEAESRCVRREGGGGRMLLSGGGQPPPGGPPTAATRDATALGWGAGGRYRRGGDRRRLRPE